MGFSEEFPYAFWGGLLLQDYLQDQGIELSIGLVIMEEFDWLFVWITYTDRRFGLVVIASLIGAIAVRTTMSRHSTILSKRCNLVLSDRGGFLSKAEST